MSERQQAYSTSERHWTPQRTGLLVAALAGGAVLGLNRLRRSPADLRGQVVLITGGTRGLGLLLGRELVQEGCRLVICARDEDELAQAHDDLTRRGGQVLAIRCDVGSRAQVEQMVEAALAHYGRVDILINNAGIIQVGPLQALNLSDFDDALAILFWGPVYTTLALLPHMLARGRGHIVNITSIGGKVGLPHMLPYTSAKFAAVGFSEGLRAELGPQGIQVTTIVPGLMRTGSFLHALFKGHQAREYTWFALASSMPLATIDATRAARQIVQAIRRGDAERILGMPAQVLTRLYGLLPDTMADLVGWGARWLLPAPTEAGQTPVPGREIQPALSPGRARVVKTLGGLGQRAARRYQALDHAGGRDPVSNTPET